MMMYCQQCGVKLVADANFCHHCGVCVTDDGTTPSASLEMVERPSPHAGEGIATTAAPSAQRDAPALSESSDAVEQELWQGGYSPKAMVGGIILVILATLGLLVLTVLGALRHMPWLWIGAVALIPLLWLIQLVRIVKRLLSAQYRLTNRRLVRQLGWINRHKDQLEMARVESVRIIQNVLHRLCGVGSIEILSSDRRLRRVVMDGIDNVDEVAETIRKLAGCR